MRVLVTGASGFLGSWVARELAASGHEIKMLARDPSRLGDRVPPGACVIQGDILSPRELATAASAADAIVHCAGMFSLSRRDRVGMHRANVEGTRNVLEAAAARGVRVVHTSSIATVGPTREPQALDEGAPPRSLGFDYPYAQSKRQSEELALASREKGLDVVVLNPGILFGPGDVNFTSTQFVLHYLRGELRMHLSGGAAFSDVRDVAAAYVAALERGRGGHRYLLGSVNLTYRDVQGMLQRLTGLHRSAALPRGLADWMAIWSETSATLRRHPDEGFNQGVVQWGSMFNYCDSTKAQAELAYEGRHFSSTLTDTIVDHLTRGAARARTSELRAMLELGGREPRPETKEMPIAFRDQGWDGTINRRQE